MSQAHWQGRYYGGRTPEREDVSLEPSPLGLRVNRADGTTLFWPWAEVRQSGGRHRDDPVRLERGGDPGESVVVEDPAFLDAAHDLAPGAVPHLDHPAHRLRNRLILVGASLAALAVGGALYLWGVPRLAARVAARVPVSWEDELGGAVANQLIGGARRCQNLELNAALSDLVRRLDAALPERRYAYRVTVVENGMVNAFAAPGGHVVVFTGLLSSTSGAEQLAGILAHEMQHVQLRHGTAAVLREVPLRLMIGALSGDISALGGVTGLLGGLGMLRYQRRAEEEADSVGLDLMRRAGIDPVGMVAAFEMLGRETGDLPRGLGYLSTHPRTEERIARMRRMAEGTTGGAAAGRGRTGSGWPLPDSTRWKELAGAC